MKILLVDNYDSFTYNLLHYLEEAAKTKVEVVRNDQLTKLDTSKYDHIVISPGPGLPKESGQLIDFIKKNQKIKMLGICLGQQAIAEVFGLRLKQLGKVVHGQAVPMRVLKKDHPLFRGLPSEFKVGRYHSWVVDRQSVIDQLEVLAVDQDLQIMAVAHPQLKITALQFHPESILSEHGKALLKNWLTLEA